MLKNSSFEDGWTTDALNGNQTPKYWDLSWLSNGLPMLSTGAFPNDDNPVVELVSTFPECVHKPQSMLPPHEWLGGPSALILSGSHVMKVFGHGFSASLSQVVECTPGSKLTLKVPMQVHHKVDGSYGACAGRVCIDGQCSRWYTFHDGFPDPAHPAWVSVEVEQIVPDNHATVRIDMEGRAQDDTSFFVDAVEMIESATEQGVDYVVTVELLSQDATLAEKEEVLARTHTNKRTILQSADDAVRLVAPGLAGSAVNVWAARRWPDDIVAYLHARGVVNVNLYEFDTLTPPPTPNNQLLYPTTHMPPVVTQPFIAGQHGGIDLRSSWRVWGDELVAAIDGTMTEVNSDRAFGRYVILNGQLNGDDVTLRYAHFVDDGVYVTSGQPVKAGDKLGRPDSTGTSTGDHLHFSVKKSGRYIDPAPLIEWPTEPGQSGGEPKVYPLRSRNLIGLHSGFPRENSFHYIDHSKTTIQKFFSAGDAYRAGETAPEIVSIWRKYVGNEEGRIGEKPTIRESAVWYLDQYSAEIDTAARNLGLTVEQLLHNITAIESLNETIPTFNPTQLQRSVEFDVCFAEETYQRYGNILATVLLCGAIGNPHETEVPLLLPAAKAAVQYNGFLGYHPYWTANSERSFLVEHWKYHAGRWQEWDKVFVAAGVYPRYACGEGGIVYAPDGVSFNSGKGWKTCGNIEKYLTDIDEFNTRALAWNTTHGNRFAGITLFGYGNWEWNDFEFGDGDIALLGAWALTV